jgi:hypothetical protein
MFQINLMEADSILVNLNSFSELNQLPLFPVNINVMY